jgi:hypothetical protein
VIKKEMSRDSEVKAAQHKSAIIPKDNTESHCPISEPCLP